MVCVIQSEACTPTGEKVILVLNQSTGLKTYYDSFLNPWLGDPSTLEDCVEDDSAKLIIWQRNSQNANAITAQQFAANFAAAEQTCFDGVVFSIPSDGQLHQSNVISKATYDAQLAPVAALNPTQVTDNFVFQWVLAADSLANMRATAIQNWVNLAEASRDAGLAGIFFDVENYTNAGWPSSVLCPGATAASCEQQMFDFGRDIVQAVAAVWPTAQIMTTLGPNHIDPNADNYVIADANPTPTNRIIGAFVLGMGVGSYGTSVKWIDGGELFGNGDAGPHTIDGSGDINGFGSQLGYDYRKGAGDSGTVGVQYASGLLTPAEEAQWPSEVSIGYAVTDDGPSGSTPARLEGDIAATLAVVDDYVWYFAFDNWFFGNPPAPSVPATQPWIDASCAHI